MQTTTQEVVLQSLIAFVVLFALARILGKRQVAQLNFFDYIAGITIGNIAASWSLDEVKSLHAVAGLLVWTILSYVMSWVQRKSLKARIFFDGRPVMLVQNGKVLEKNLVRAKMDSEELMLLLRQKNVFKLADVELAVLETNGMLNVMKKTELQPLTPKDAGIQVVSEQEPHILIIDGNLMTRSLDKSGYSKEWLLGKISEQGAKDFRDVFLAQVDSNGNVYVDLYRDSLNYPQVKQKPLLAASLKKIQADLEMFALETHNRNAKQSYTYTAGQLNQLIEEILPFLKE